MVCPSTVLMNRNGIPSPLASVPRHTSLSLLPVLNAIKWLHHCLSFFFFFRCQHVFVSKLHRQNLAVPAHHVEGGSGMSLRQLTDKEARMRKNKMRWRIDEARDEERTEGGREERNRKDTCPPGVAVSSQSGGLICVRVWILSPLEASRRLIKTEVELKLDPQEDGGHNNGTGKGSLSTLPPPLMLCLFALNTSDLAQSVLATLYVTSLQSLTKSSSIQKQFIFICYDNAVLSTVTADI